jgi:uncharacterized protein YkwD
VAAEDELLADANESRARAGARPLRMEESLRKAARIHARLMIAGRRLEHQFPGEAPLLGRIAQVSALAMDGAGENLAYAACAPGANEVLMHSAPHRENLLNPRFNLAGIAALWRGGKLYVVQDFGHEVASYSARERAELVSRAVGKARREAGLPELVWQRLENLDETACGMAEENRPNARLLAAAYSDRKIVTYTQSRPEVLPEGALRLLRQRDLSQFAVGSCYARSASYPTGTYWVAILLY